MSEDNEFFGSSFIVLRPCRFLLVTLWHEYFNLRIDTSFRHECLDTGCDCLGCSTYSLSVARKCVFVCVVCRAYLLGRHFNLPKSKKNEEIYQQRRYGQTN